MAIRHGRALLLVGILMGCIGWPSLGSAEDDDIAARRKAAQALADNAFDLMQQGLHEEAAELFHKADQRFHSPVFVLFEAEAVEKQGKLLPARALLSSVANEKLAEYAPDAFRKAQAKARVSLAKIDARIPTVLIELPGADPSTVEVVIGDRRMRGTDTSSVPIQLEVGSYVIRASGEEDRTDEASVTLVEGDRKEVSLNVGLPPKTGDADDSEVPTWIGPAIAFGVGGAGLIMGVAAGAVFLGEADDVKARCAAYPTPGSDANVCPPDAGEDIDRVSVLGNVATAGFVIAGLGAVAGTLLLVLTPGEDETSALRPELWAGPTGMMLRGRF